MTRLQRDKGSPWIMVRVRRTTHATLREWGRKWMELGLVGPGVQGGGERDEPAIDALIQELLRRDEEHRQRGRKSRAAKGRKGRKGPNGQADGDGAAVNGNEYIEPASRPLKERVEPDVGAGEGGTPEPTGALPSGGDWSAEENPVWELR